jgi:signal transduction histidine kinase
MSAPHRGCCKRHALVLAMTTANFRVSTRILQRLGEELITSFSQGIVELVKNSYDADASRCIVELRGTDKPGGTVVITDDGDGMSISDIQDGWLVIGRSNKVSRIPTRQRRLPAGSKGLGRLAALRMGEEVLLSTCPREEPDAEYQLLIKWADFDQSDAIEDVRLDVRRSTANRSPGTRIEVIGLRESVDERDVRSLARELILLSDPFADPSGFKPDLVAPEFGELEKLVQEGYFDECELRLTAKLNDKGRASATVFDRAGNVRWTNSEEELKGTYQAPTATFELWVFLLQSGSFVESSVTLSEVRAWLREVGGVHLYHRGLRVRPYGDLGHDWLDMNLSRSRSPERRPSTNTSVGRVTVVDANEVLLQKTDRTGFVENYAFAELRRFSIEALNWMQSKRLAERARLRQEELEKASGHAEQASMDLHRAIPSLAPEDRPVIQHAASEFESATASERNVLQNELTLYQTLASVGTSVSVLAHRIEGPARNLGVSVHTVERRTRRILGDEYEAKIGSPIEDVKRYAELVSKFAILPLNLLRRGKRRQTVLELNKTIAETVDLYEPYLKDSRVETILEFCDGSVKVRGSVAAIEAIMSNLITNAVKAFKRKEEQLGDRTLIIRTTVAGERVEIRVSDSGPGIEEGLGETIWLPGITVDEDGTGFGLTIVRDTVAQLGGRIGSVSRGELGGAEFMIELPRVGT